MLAVRCVFVKSYNLTLIIFRSEPPLWSTISTTMSIGFTAREVIPSESSGLIILTSPFNLDGSHVCWILHLRYVILPASQNRLQMYQSRYCYQSHRSHRRHLPCSFPRHRESLIVSECSYLSHSSSWRAYNFTEQWYVGMYTHDFPQEYGCSFMDRYLGCSSRYHSAHCSAIVLGE